MKECFSNKLWSFPSFVGLRLLLSWVYCGNFCPGDIQKIDGCKLWFMDLKRKELHPLLPPSSFLADWLQTWWWGWTTTLGCPSKGAEQHAAALAALDRSFSDLYVGEERIFILLKTLLFWFLLFQENVYSKVLCSKDFIGPLLPKGESKCWKRAFKVLPNLASTSFAAYFPVTCSTDTVL